MGGGDTETQTSNTAFCRGRVLPSPRSRATSSRCRSEKPNRTLTRRPYNSLSPSDAAPRGAGCSPGSADSHPPAGRLAGHGATSPGRDPAPGSAVAPRPDGGAGRRENGGGSGGSASQSRARWFPPPARGRGWALTATAARSSGGPGYRSGPGLGSAPPAAAASSPGAALPPERRRERPQLPRRALRD